MTNLAKGRVSLKFNNLVVVQENSSSLYSNFILNLYIVYELNNSPCNPTNDFTLKNCLFCTVRLTKNADKSKFNYNDLRVTFDGKCICSYGNNFARNVVIFSVDNTSSSHTDNKKNKLSFIR